MCVFGKVINVVCERQQVLFVRFSSSAVIQSISFIMNLNWCFL